MNQIELISEYWHFEDMEKECTDPRLSVHLENILAAIAMLIASHGPTPEFYEWEKLCKPAPSDREEGKK